MRASFTLALMLAIGAPGAALADCPPPIPGSTAAEIKANEQRLVCLQNALAQRTSEDRQRQERDALDAKIRQFELARDRSGIMFKPPPIAVTPPAYVPPPPFTGL